MKSDNRMMGLYWKDIELLPGMLLEVEEYNRDVLHKDGGPASVRWKILSFETRGRDEAYFELKTGRKYSLEEVMKKRKLRSRLENAALLQIPPCTDFMVVTEYHDGNEVFKRCYSLDLLATVKDIQIVSGE